MPLLESLLLTLGASIAKALVKQWLGEGMVADVLPPLVDLGKGKTEKGLERWRESRRIEAIGEQVAEGMRPLLERVPPDSRQTVIREVALTLTRADLNARLVLEARGEPKRIAEQLETASAGGTDHLSADETALYHRMLLEISGEMVKLTSALDGFTRDAALLSLRNEDTILDAVEKLARRPDEAAVHFEATYRQSIKRELDRMEPFGLTTLDREYAAQSLSVSYISLQVASSTPASEGENGDELEPFHVDELEQQIPMPSGERIPQAMQSSVGRADQVLAPMKRLVVRGEAGSGKTTLLQWIAVRAAANDFESPLDEWNDAIPFFIRLRERVGQDFPAPEEYPALVDPTIAGAMPSRDWVHAQLGNGRALVLIDGVDELPAGQREGMLAALNRLISAYPLARYIVSSRPTALKEEEWPEWHEWVRQLNFTEVSLQRMDREQIEQFVDHWHDAVAALLGARRRTEAQTIGNLAIQLKKQLRHQPQLRRLASNPLLCAVICALHRTSFGNLPAERTSLYGECTEMLLTEREQKRGIQLPEYPKLGKTQKLDLMRRFAYWLMKKDRSDVSVERADEYFEKLLEDLHLATPTTGALVRAYFVERTSMLREPVAGRVDFTHRTFQEYLTAEAILDDDGVEELLKYATDDLWRETIILAAGLRGQRDREMLLKSLVDRGEREPDHERRLHLLALACLETARTRSLKSEVESYVLERTKHLFPPQDRDEARTVAAGGESVIPFLAPNPDYSAGEAAACVHALSLVGSTGAMQAIAAYAGDDRIEVKVEIGHSWGDFDHATFAQEVLKLVSVLYLPRFVAADDAVYLTHLKGLAIQAQGEVADLAPLTALRELQEVTLADTGVRDLRPLAALSHLQALQLHDTQVSDLVPLAGLSQLRILTLWKTQVSDLSPLAGLSQLQTLALFSTPVSNLRPLADLSQLQILYLGNTQVTDLRPLASLSRLQTLTLWTTQVSDLRPLTGLPQLQDLDLSNTQVSDLRPLAGLPQLQNLDLNYTQVSDLRPLAGLSQLRNLNLSSTQVSDLHPLVGLSQLERIELTNKQADTLVIPLQLQDKISRQPQVVF